MCVELGELKLDFISCLNGWLKVRKVFFWRKSLGLSIYTKSVCLYRKWFYRKLSIFREWFTLNQNKSFFNQVLLKVLFFGAQILSERNVFLWKHGSGASQFYEWNKKICYGYFLFWQFHCGKDVFGCPENWWGKVKFCL